MISPNVGVTKVKMRVDPNSWSNPMTPSYEPIAFTARQTGY